MNKNLRPTLFTSGERAKKLGSKGGKVRSPKKKMAAKLTAMKRFGVKSKDAAWLMKMLTDPREFSADILIMFNTVRKDVMDSEKIPHRDKMLLIKTATEVFKTIHGDRQLHKFEGIEEVNINILPPSHMLNNPEENDDSRIHQERDSQGDRGDSDEQ